MWSAGWDDTPLPDAFPDPAGRHLLSPAVLIRLGHGVCGRAGVVVWHQVAVVRYEVALQFVKVLNRYWEEKLHSTEDVQQCLRSAGKNKEGSASGGAAGVGKGVAAATDLIFLRLGALHLHCFPITVDSFTLFHLHSDTTHVTTGSHDCWGGII